MDDAIRRILGSRHSRDAGRFGPAVLLVLVFIIDWNTPLGFAVCIAYAPAVLLAALTRQRIHVAAVALAAMLLTLAGIFLSPPALPGTPGIFIVVHRALALAAIATSALLAIFVIRLVNRFAAANRMLDMASTLGKLGGWRVDLEAGQVHWSNEVARIHGEPAGYSPSLEEGINYYAPEHQVLIRQRVGACIEQGTPFAEEMQIVTRGGERRWVRCVGRAVRDEREAIIAIQGAFQDIGEHKSIETQLRQSLASWHSLAEAMPMTVWTANEDGTLDYFNQSMSDYSGLSRQELLPNGWMELVHPDDGAATLATWRRAMQDLTPYEAQFRLRRHDGAYRWHISRAAHVPDSVTGAARWYGSAVDIDDQMRLQHEARTLADRLTATMESVGDAILALDSQWRAVYINQHAEILLNTKREELIGEHIWSKFPEAVGSTFEKEYRRCVEQQVAVRFEEYFAPLQKHFEINAYPAPDGLTVYFRDITQQRMLAEQMIQAQKLESLGRLTGGVAHDFNNLLTVILGNAEMLVEQAAPGATEHVLAEMIFDAAQRGAAMTQRLLAFARKQALEPAPSDLNRLVASTDRLLRHTLGGHIEIEMLQAGGLWLTLVDPGQLESALLNLAINARDAMPDGGRLTIETGNADLDEAYASQHSGVAPGEYVMLAVTDSGNGIAPELLARVFEPFYTTKQMGKGTGLGLAMVYGFVMQSKGHIAIYSELGHGTTVKIYLPRLVNAELPGAPASAAELVQCGSNQLILLTEDDAMVRAYARGQLLELGYRVIEAASAAEALELLHEQDDIDLLLTDVVMPGGMSGRQLADAVQAFRPTLPILFTSGYTEGAMIHHGRLEPGVMLLNKPYRRAELAHKVAAALAPARMEAQ
ncbi:PAS domain S-box protein [Massilia sp. GCM10020059]|uniref:histidine kinase n=1 Tax=Massilia agrisoli TaxID=2892444 RepID=A0ABS8IWR5_9BURK|nr:PAS domain S-box protein [Massilia agrisoli]MCC6071674.1 PAS domain S-box protein [Massilia agrisoli]